MTTSPYQAAVAAYADELRTLFAPEPASSRSTEVQPVAPDQLAGRADRLADRAAALTAQTAAFLSDDDPGVRLGAEQNLLAQAAAALRVAEGLLVVAALDDATATRSAGPPLKPAFDDLLALIEAPLAVAGGEVAGEPGEPDLSRSVALDAGRADLMAAAAAAIDQVMGGVGSFVQDALAGLLGLDTALLKQAAQLISAELADLVGQVGAQASLLVAKAARFLLQAYDSLLVALGQDAAGALRQQAAAWVEQVQQGDVTARVVGAALQVDAVRERVDEVVSTVEAPAEALGQALVAVQALPGSFQARTRLAGQALAAIAVLKRIPAARLPMIELASAAVYLGLLGFVVYTGGDYVDAPRLARVGRVRGVLQIVETVAA